ncbi:MAG: Malate synthase, partial [Proteobacteria bacterium]|nr:Malate synthase [Pseudomonadota bacterium]
MTTAILPDGVEILGEIPPAYAEILSPKAIAFVAKLARKFEAQRRDLMARRAKRQAEFDAGQLPDFLAETRHVRDSDWSIASVPADLQDRRVEITGPVDRKMIINALNSGASVFMADFEDSNSPTWENVVLGH